MPFRRYEVLFFITVTRLFYIKKGEFFNYYNVDKLIVETALSHLMYMHVH